MDMKRLLLAKMLLASGILRAQSADESAGDAPDRGVARISMSNGNVSVRHGDWGEVAAAAMNAPLVTTDRLVTGEGSRAEIQFDSANAIRLAPASEVRLGDLQYHRYQVQLAVGTTIFRVLRDTDAQVEISTPSVSVRPVRKGIYRVTVKARAPKSSSTRPTRSAWRPRARFAWATFSIIAIKFSSRAP